MLAFIQVVLSVIMLASYVLSALAVWAAHGDGTATIAALIVSCPFMTLGTVALIGLAITEAIDRAKYEQVMALHRMSSLANMLQGQQPPILPPS
jgi:hypothetical protein